MNGVNYMYTIYVDVLIILNIYVNFFLIITTAKIMHSPIKTGRCIAAAVYGSLYSLLILIPHLGIFINTLIKLAAAVTIILIAFGFGGKLRLIKESIVFFAINIILAGVIYAVYSWLKPEFMHFNNTYFYMDFSLIILVITTAAMYFAVSIARRFADRIPEKTGYYKIIIRYRDKTASLSGIADTGNVLVDFFSGKPVIVCGRDKLQEITGEADFDFSAGGIPKGFRMIPCSTVSGSSLMPVFKPDEIIILDAEKNIKKVEALVGFGASDSEAVFNPRLLKC